MIISPIRNSEKYDSDYNNYGDTWIVDGVNYYSKFGLKAHNGQDIATPAGISVYSPIDGRLIIDNEKGGFGLYVIIYGTDINSVGDKRRIRLAHLSKVLVESNIYVKAGDLIAKTGKSGGVAPHLHWDYAIVNSEYEVNDYKNGFHGCLDIFKKKYICSGDPCNL